VNRAFVGVAVGKPLGIIALLQMSMSAITPEP
jgi:hypothetical protein